MLIGVNCCELVAHSGGLRQYCSRLMRELLREGGDEYRFFWTARNRATLDALLGDGWERNGIEVDHPRAIAPRLPRLDLYFCPTGLLVPRPVPVASVVMVPDIQEAYFPRFFSLREQWSRAYHHGAALHQADRVVTLSEFCRDGMTTIYGIPSAKIAVIPLAAGDAPAGALPAGLPERFLLYPANFWRHKNHDGLLRALALARDRHHVRLHCVLTGAPVPSGYDVASALARHRLADQVTVLGYQPDEVVAGLYRAATALVFPSLHEGFGLPLVEAMASGCPIACANGTSLPEVAGDAAAYFAATDPTEMAAVLVKVWTDAGLRAALAEKGRARARQFSRAAMAQAHRRVFAGAHADFAHRPRAWTRPTEFRYLLESGLQALRHRW